MMNLTGSYVDLYTLIPASAVRSTPDLGLGDWLSFLNDSGFQSTLSTVAGPGSILDRLVNPNRNTSSNLLPPPPPPPPPAAPPAPNYTMPLLIGGGVLALLVLSR